MPNSNYYQEESDDSEVEETAIHLSQLQVSQKLRKKDSFEPAADSSVAIIQLHDGPAEKDKEHIVRLSFMMVSTFFEVSKIAGSQFKQQVFAVGHSFFNLQ